MAKIEGVDDVVKALKKKGVEAGGDSKPSVVVGYSAEYALWVHENRQIHPPGQKLIGQPRPSGLGEYWNPNGRPGFLLDVMREITGELSNIVSESMKKGMPLIQALYLAGLRLQRESQQNVPVEYGFLRASAFTRPENGESVEGEMAE